MKKKNKLLRNQNGSISMFVIVSVLFLTFVLIGIYTSYANKLKAQEEQLGKIQGNYGEHASEDGMDKLYIAQTQPEDDNEDEETGDTDTTLLPSEYQQVEYIESTGTQYIDTGVNGGNTMAFNIKMNSLGKTAIAYEQYFAGDKTPKGVKLYAHGSYIVMQDKSASNVNLYSMTDTNTHIIEFTTDGTAKVDNTVLAEKITNARMG